MTHTPGPWTTYTTKTSHVVMAGHRMDGTTIANVRYKGQEDEANADLIAAAPDMRQALLDLVNWYDMDEGDLRPLMNAARVVLARVEKL